MRRTTTLTALLLGATLLAPTGAASAAGETCRGEAATIVGTDAPIVGTDGRDVIVTGTSITTSAGAGDDLICVTGLPNFNSFSVDAGPGNDLVDSSTLPVNSYLTASLGDGADTFIGGVASERVAAGAAGFIWVDVPSESERDVIDTGDGSDSVISGGPGLANDDAVRTGSGDDNVWWSGVMGAQSVLDAGDGSDLLIARASGQTFAVDLTGQKLSRNGVVEGAFGSIERLKVHPEPDLGIVEVLGTDGDDSVGIDAAATIRADLGSGDDRLNVTTTKPGTNIDLGSGTDQIHATPLASVQIELGRGAMNTDGFVSVPLAGAERAFASAKSVILKGSKGADVLVAVGCSAVVNGHDGNDYIEHSNYDADRDQGYDCDSGSIKLLGGSGSDTIEGGVRADRIYGGAGNDKIDTGPARSGKNEVWGGGGNDRIQGGGDRDVLSGGAGRDKINGSKGRDVAIGGRDRDTCRAEVEKSCER
ncbi:MAG: calcium-binding protein [Nocardioides sp.]|uniref:calcium-binding protein n=1 Tax=Nocardioides sp. TaxID=35761 RepID=UPI0032662459